MNRHELAMPFKRFQVQPVWRADRPQRGRYREFYQCDADVVGTDSLLCEAEIILMLNEVFKKLKLDDFSIKVNNRKILTGITEAIDAPGKEAELCVAIDKLDKIGKTKVEDELKERGFSDSSISSLQTLFTLSEDNNTALAELKSWLRDTEIGLKGISELEEVLSLVDGFGLKENNVSLDFSLARGLSYYTGAIFEVKAGGVSIGSISGGGRYDDLTSTFGMPNLSGVGISFGVDRIYDVLDELELFPANATESTKVLLTNFDSESQKACLPILAKLRSMDIAAELYPSSDKMKKQFEYANKKGIAYVLLVGSEEIKNEKYSLKDMASGEQESLSLEQIIEKLHA
jgi:histidyl-tRNA synthetase